MRILISIIIWIGEIVGAGAALFLLYWGPLQIGLHIVALEEPDSFEYVRGWILGFCILALIGMVLFLIGAGLFLLFKEVKPLHKLLILAKHNLSLSDKIWSKAKPTWDEVKEGEP